MTKWNLDVLEDANTKITQLRKHLTTQLDNLYRFRSEQQANGLWISAQTDREIGIYETIWKMVK